jgi:hypothetical protein
MFTPSPSPSPCPCPNLLEVSDERGLGWGWDLSVLPRAGHSSTNVAVFLAALSAAV